MAHKTKVNGTNYDISGGKTRVNGTNYKVEGGKTRVGGTNYKIALYRTVTINITDHNSAARIYVNYPNTGGYPKSSLTNSNETHTIEVPIGTVVNCRIVQNTSSKKGYIKLPSGETITSNESTFSYDFKIQTNTVFTLTSYKQTEMLLYQYDGEITITEE